MWILNDLKDSIYKIDQKLDEHLANPEIHYSLKKDISWIIEKIKELKD